ncbi:YfdQ family protein [Agarilytica rhodophyticola]|uniref:YfdQ family protein n=1 Tax=Agarilytica rhodophyticola TaxID=1737490 RepID=UPI000B346695|nr:DUF2303 family protein [Agarilytica rhodophyticola]
MNDSNSDIVEIFEKGKTQTIQTNVDNVPVFITPEGMEIHSLENLVDSRAEKPKRLEQHITLLSSESFIEYYNKFSTTDSAIFVDQQQGDFVAILDYHADHDTPAWCKHVARYRCPKTKEFSTWVLNSNNKMGQEDFALFIEENSRNIAEPNAAEMLEIASSLKAKKDVDFKSSIRLDNGETQFEYVESIGANAGANGQLSIPEKIKINTRAFQGGDTYELEARFRYRILQQGLQMWYTIITPHLVIEDAVTQVVDEVKENINEGSVFISEAPL